MLQLLIYLLLCLSIFKSKIRSWVSPLADIRYSWLLSLLFAFIVIWSIQTFIFLFTFVWKVKSGLTLSYRLYLLFTFIFFVGAAIAALIKPEIFSSSKKYQSLGIKDSDKKEYIRRLLAVMEKDKIYLDPSLTLITLAKKLSIPSAYLSRVVNESFDMNFCDFINKYRIEESKQHLKEIQSSKKTILEIAYSVGFNSKSTFYDAFKNQTGSTPKEFLKNNFSYN